MEARMVEARMDPLGSTLSRLRSMTLERIAAAARQGDVEPLRALGELVARIDADLRVLKEIEARSARYADDLAAALSDRNGDEPEVIERPEVVEDDPRAPFLEAAAAAGHPLTALGRTLYHTPAGRSVAVPYANEARPGRWLLSVEDMRYDVVALLCRTMEGELATILVPWRVLEPIWKGLSRNGRQVKLGVLRRAGGYWLSVPGTEPLSLAPFVGAYRILGAEA